MIELITLVDKNDQVIGSKPRNLLNKNDRWRIVTVWVINQKGQLLIAKRSPHKTYGSNRWGPSVAGTVEHGDNYYQTATRELQEELGIVLPIKKLGLTMHEGGVGSRADMHYICKTNMDIEQFHLQESEVSDVRWINFTDLKKELAAEPEIYIESMNEVISKIKDELEFYL